MVTVGPLSISFIAIFGLAERPPARLLYAFPPVGGPRLPGRVWPPSGVVCHHLVVVVHVGLLQLLVRAAKSSAGVMVGAAATRSASAMLARIAAAVAWSPTNSARVARARDQACSPVYSASMTVAR